MDSLNHYKTHRASDLIKSFKSKELSLVSYFDELFDFIENTDSEYNSLTSLQKEYALSQAKKLSALSDNEIEKMPLFGVPVILKENIQKTDFPVECASKILKGYRGQYDATAVKYLESAGAILIGTANMDEFAMGAANEHSVHGPVKNPTDKTLVSGGSSGGSAASCALGFAPLTLGSETGGSVRVPAAFCGIFGFKPSYGRVSRYGLVAYGSSLDQISPFARSAQDLDLIMQTIGQPDVQDATTLNNPYVSEIHKTDTNKFDSVTIGIPRDLITQNVAPHVLEEFQKLEQTLSEIGIKFKDIEIQGSEYALSAYYVMACAEASSNLSRFDGIRFGHRTDNAVDLNELYCKSRSEGFGFEVKKRIMLGTFALSAGYYDAFYGKALAVRHMLTSAFTDVFKEVDFLYLPTTPDSAFKLGANNKDQTKEYLYDMFTVLANLAQAPAISVPVKNLKQPVGLQFMAPKEHDAKLIAFAHYLEEKGLVGVSDE